MAKLNNDYAHVGQRDYFDRAMLKRDVALEGAMHTKIKASGDEDGLTFENWL